MSLANVFYSCWRGRGGGVRVISLSDMAHKKVIKMKLEVTFLQLGCYSLLAAEQRDFNRDH